jgi:hypothetical protein
MDDKQLQAAIKNQITNATGYLGSEITEARTTAMRDYLGEPMGNEIDGRSQVISSDVQDVIESVMPDLIQIFTSSDKAVRFEPVGPEDEDAAEQATDYINHVWNVDNPGFILFYDWFKDALLQKLGVIKKWWDTSERTERRKFTGLSDNAVALLLQEPGVEVLEHDEYWAPEAIAQGLPADLPVESAPPEIAEVARRHNITIKRSFPKNVVHIENVPPEEFLVSRRARSLDDAPFLAHKTSPTQSDLIADGYDKTQVEGLSDGENDEFSEEKTRRFSDEDGFNDEEADRSMREIMVHECYMRVDWDDDGIAELRKITVAGPSYEILKYKDGTMANEEVADHPFSGLTPIRMPHKVFGRSLAELVQDIQYIKTSILRQLLDNMYNINNARAAISDKVNLDDYLDNKVGAPIRVQDTGGNIGGHILPIVTAPIGNHAYPLLEYVDTVRETRTGINRLGQGLDPDALNSTASGINQLLGRSQQRTLLIAQLFAFGVGRAFKKILKLVVENQDQARMIRLRNQWVEIDPRSWNADMDCTTDVGLGRGTQDQQIQTANHVLQATNALVTLQSGVSGPFVMAHHVRAAYAKFYEAIGIRSADPYLAEIGEEQSMQIAQAASEQPNPEMAKLELQAQEMQANMQLQIGKEQMTHMRELLKIEKKDEADQAKLDLDAHLGAAKIMLDYDKLRVDSRTKMMVAASKPKPAAGKAK